MRNPIIWMRPPTVRLAAILVFLAHSPICPAAVYKCPAKDGSTTYSDMPCEQNAQVIQVTPEPLHSTPPPTAQSPAPGNEQLNHAQEQMAALCARGDVDAWYHTQKPPPTPEQKNAKLQEALRKCRATLTPQNSATPVPQVPTAKQSTGSVASSPAPMPTQGANAPLTPAMIAAAQDKSARETSASLCSTKAFNEWIKAQGHPLPDPNVRIAKLTEISNQCRRPLGLSDMVPPAPIAAPKPILQGPAGAAAATNLAQLVKSGSIDHLQTYLASPGVDINARPGTDEALLDYAAEQNQAQIARFLLEHGARVDAAQTQGGNSGYTALHRAAIVDAAEVAELLLAHGAEVNVHGPLGITPLILAASNGSRRTAEVLLSHGADVSVPTGHQETALSEASAHGHLDIVRLLLIHVPTPTTSSMNAVAMRGDLQALRLMLRHDELVHDVSSLSKDLALRFTTLGPDRPEERKQMIELLLADGADIDNVQDGFQVIPVMLATTPEMVEFLFAHGANKKAKLTGAQLTQWFVCNNTGKDPVGMLQVVIAHGIDIGGTTPQGSSALPCAARANNPALQPFLAQHQVGVGRLNENAPRAASEASTMQAQNVSPQSAVTTANERRATKVLTLLNKNAIQSASTRTLKDRVSMMAPYFLKKLDPGNPDWNSRHPKWPTMQALVEKGLLDEISERPTAAERNIETVYIREYAAKMTPGELQVLTDYLATPEGKRYVAFEYEVEAVYNEGLRALQSNQPMPHQEASDAIQKQRLRLLALSTSTMVAMADYEIAQKQHGDISGFQAIPIMMQAASSYKGSELDALWVRYSRDVPGFASFSESAASKRHFAGMAASQTATMPLLTGQIEAFAKAVEAKHMAQWQQAYQEQVQKPNQVTQAADVARRTASPMPKAGTNFKECPDCPEMIVVPAGSFNMGSPDDEVGRPDKNNVNLGHSEGPVHRVQVPSFAIGKFEITRAQFSAFTRETGYGGVKGDWPQPADFHQEANHPVVGVNAADVDAYVSWLARKTGKPYRLPTEAEWEYAARANTTTAYYWGNDAISICQYANVRDETAQKAIPWASKWPTVKCADGFAYTAPVGSFKPNAFGLYDMLGNASEAVADCTDNRNYDGAPTDGSVVWVSSICDQKKGRIPWHGGRGGSWRYGAEDARAASRSGAVQQDRQDSNGFRIARSLP
jgi:formylglycine-generating enzyme required for sulfatase activity/ankyrin repeat protein